MSESVLYRMEDINYNNFSDGIIFIFSLSDEDRATRVFDQLLKENVKILELIIIKYNNSVELPGNVKSHIDESKIKSILINNSSIDFVNFLKSLSFDNKQKAIVIDISCIHVPEMFTLLKFLKVEGICGLDIVYSVPFDYNFTSEPFTSYKSYSGDLKMVEPIGFSGSTNSKNVELYMFIGFEGPLALKVHEDCEYSELKLINSLPSFFPKYKDIAIINNYKLMQYPHTSLYVPADNPFETYNLLESSVNKDNNICIAPLSTKPIALGICLFALYNESVRVVYPTSEKYNANTTHSIYKSCLYHIDF